MLSLFIGAVTMGMAETMEEREKAKEAEKAAARDADNAVAMEATPALDRRAELMHAVEEAWSGGGQGVAQLFVENEAALGPWWRMYLWLARQCRKITLSSAFQNTITGCILAASLLVGMSTAPNLESNLVLKILDLIILGVFTLEVFLKIIAEGFKPLRCVKRALLLLLLLVLLHYCCAGRVACASADVLPLFIPSSTTLLLLLTNSHLSSLSGTLTTGGTASISPSSPPPSCRSWPASKPGRSSPCCASCASFGF